MGPACPLSGQKNGRKWASTSGLSPFAGGTSSGGESPERERSRVSHPANLV
ncbi:hypothetical protein Y88_2342 [Novosphingobium nitrogenifigens DSM 19370]|uniref:Uncharacterized protein n=1 Tax=Novosphingobium nitrogenifigens DSM 19370 TaxID=983920 RepID=F1Z6B9_9SPHN|nr:hypothetical protein Y88_2342 [Novosphingobium nitrogenifigens DSM 19370]